MATIINNINKLDLKGNYTYADYLLWNFKERVELIKGKIVKMSPAPSTSHQRISGELTYLLSKVFRKSKCQMFVAPFDVRLVNYKQSTQDNQIVTVVQPDLCVVCDINKLDEKGCIGSPDLIIEILSPGNSNREMTIKFDLYEENGVKEYWIVEPAENSIFIYTLKQGKYIGLKPCIEGQIITSPLFPELDFEIEKVFQ
jgi:Uma2 family endonuclease